MDKYTEYLLDQINMQRDIAKEDTKIDSKVAAAIAEELLNALVQYQNSMDCRKKD